MKTCGIYGIHNTANDKWYIGQSVNIERRTPNHFWDLKNNKHYNKHLQHSFIKYGTISFELHILEKVPENMLDVREQAWIAFYKSSQEKHGYNLQSGGHINHCCAIITRNKIARAQQGKKNHSYGKHPSLETRIKMSNAHKNCVFSKVHRENLSKHKPWNYGKHLSKKHRINLSKPKNLAFT